MNNRIQDAFKTGKALIGFVTGGDPSVGASENIIVAMAEAGADIIEIGIPFSDPIAEGVAGQAANLRALSNGATVDKMFELVRSVRAKIETPLVFSTYLNPVFKRGYDKFFTECKDAGVDGVIIPDLPFDEHGEIKHFAREHGVALISVIASVSEARIAAIAHEADGFLNIISPLGGGDKKNDLKSIVNIIRANTDVPIVAGLSFQALEQADEMLKYADGVTADSAIAEIIARCGENSALHVAEYIKTVKQAIG